MAVETNMSTTQSLAADIIPLLIKEKMLSISDKQTVFFEIGDRETLPEGNGKTVQFTRYERLTLPSVPLSESDTPTATPLTTSIVQAVVDQWGAVVALSDVAQMTVRHPALRVAQQRLGTQHAETIDREIQKVLMGGSNATFANNKTTRLALAAGDVLTTDDVRRVVSTLRATGTPSYDEQGNFVGVFDPYVEMDVTKDGTFVNAMSFSQVRQLLVGEVGQWMGVRWKRSNLIPIITTLAFTPGSVTTGLGTFTPFTGGADTVQIKVTRLDANTGFETEIDASTGITNGANFKVSLPTTTFPNDGRTYNIYASVANGAAGTETFQLQVTGAGQQIFLFKAIGTDAETALNRVLRITGSLAPPDTSTAGNVHISYIMGREAFGVVELGGLTTTITPAAPVDSDPLMQRRKVGWKQLFKAVIKNVDFFRRLESLSAFN